MRINGNDSWRDGSFLDNLNKTIRNSYGNEIVMHNNLSQEIKLDDLMNLSYLIEKDNK